MPAPMQRTIPIVSEPWKIPESTIDRIGTRRFRFKEEDSGLDALARLLKVLPGAVRKFSDLPPPAILRPVWGETEAVRNISKEFREKALELVKLREASKEEVLP